MEEEDIADYRYTIEEHNESFITVILGLLFGLLRVDTTEKSNNNNTLFSKSSPVIPKITIKGFIFNHN
ncbi:hypothetical protein SAMN05216352_101470 [Alteribacillus bidgolensis]|uniref:Uncharacterized protein n=1 Tax=Alteribacillus bidgolensis TaxID=930129 RepID=A0A1G8CWE2_9BACI|nr:hypothetical protein SAMN05216352_101470 [Alteribacillus bidgolensis]